MTVSSSGSAGRDLFQPDFPDDWAPTQLYAVAVWVNGLAFKDGDFSETGRPVIKIAEIKNGISGQTRFTGNDYDPKYLLSAGDMLFSWSGQPETSIDTFRWYDREGWLNQHIFKVLPKVDLVEGSFLFQLLKYLKPNFVGIARNKQTTGLGHVTKRDLEAIEVRIPGRAEQRGIAATLGALDDKIESNRRAIDLILGLATALVDGAMTSGAEWSTVEELATFHNRRRVPLSSKERDERPGPYPYYGATGIFGYIDDYLFDEVLVLIGEDGSVVRQDGSPIVQYVWEKAWINNHAHPLTGRGISNELLFILLLTADVRPLVTGAVQPKISMGNLKTLALALPDSTARPRIERELASIFALYRCRIDENRSLTKLRDTLLPELLSGRIRVPDSRDAVEAAV